MTEDAPDAPDYAFPAIVTLDLNPMMKFAAQGLGKGLVPLGAVCHRMFCCVNVPLHCARWAFLLLLRLQLAPLNSRCSLPGDVQLLWSLLLVTVGDTVLLQSLRSDK